MVSPSAAGLADGDGQQDDDAARDQLLAELQAHQDQAVVDQADHQRADDRADDGAGATKQAGAAQHRRRDHRQLVTLAEREPPGVQPARVQHSRQPRRHAGDHQHAQLDRARVDAGVVGRDRVAAGRQHAPPKRGPPQHEVADDGGQQHPDQQDRHRPEVAAAEPERVAATEDRDRRRVADPPRGAAGDAQHRQRGEERWDADPGGQQTVTQPDDKPGEKPDHDAERPAAKVDRHGGGDGREPRDGADRQVDLARRKHERDRDRHDRDHRRLAHDVEQVVGVEEAAVAECHREDQKDRDETQIDDVLAPGGGDHSLQGASWRHGGGLRGAHAARPCVREVNGDGWR